VDGDGQDGSLLLLCTIPEIDIALDRDVWGAGDVVACNVGEPCLDVARCGCGVGGEAEGAVGCPDGGITERLWDGVGEDLVVVVEVVGGKAWRGVLGVVVGDLSQLGPVLRV